MNEQIIPTEGQIESGEARDAETQTLDDATYDPRTCVETGNDYQGAEDKQENLVRVTENALSAAENEGATPLPIPQPENAELSPDDVKVDPFAAFGNEGATPLPIPQPESAELSPDDVKVDPNTAFGNEGATPLPIPHEADHANGDLGSDKLGVDPLTGDEFGGEHSANKPERILPENLPGKEKLGVGMGPNGMIEKGVNVSQGKLIPGGSGTSGGGPPVGNYGPGTRGTDDGNGAPNKGKEQGSAPWISKQDEKSINDGLKAGDFSKEEAEKLEAQLQDEALTYYQVGGHVSNTIDGVSPIPYTGSGSWGSEPDPDLVGGPDKESGHFTPIISINGKSAGGGGSSDDPDDSAKFTGDPNLTASGSRPNNPDDPDYYTPNILEDASKTAKVTK